MEPSITRYSILGLDIAAKCGYHCIAESGTWDFTESKRRNDNKMHGAFRRTLIDCIKRNNIKQICAEDVTVNQHFTDFRRLAELRGVLLEVCDTLDLPEPFFVNPMTVKKWATGDGRATKEKMVEFCKKRWKIEVTDHNEADATHIFYYTVKRFNL